jgi:4-amino-4-deoxy-L-arabinose transferase-like glycosyltransferase
VDDLKVVGSAAARGTRTLPDSLAGLGAGAVVVGLASLIAIRDLGRAATFDEGVYLNSLRALQRGAPLGTKVFASQPPGYYLLLRLDAFLFPGSLTGLRLGFLLLGLAGCVSVFLLGRLYSGVFGGAMAALLFIAAAPVLHLVSRTSADSAAVSLSLVGIALVAYAWQGRISRGWLALLLSLAGGAALAAASTIKLDGVFAVVAVCLLAAVVRPHLRLLLAALGGGLATLAGILAPFAEVAPQLWRSVVSFHFVARNVRGVTLAGGTSGLRNNAVNIASAFELRTNVVAWLILIGASGLLIHGLRGTDRRILWLLAWPLAVLAFLLWQTPLFSQHVVLLAGASAVPAGVGFAYAARVRDWRRRLAIALAATAALAAYAYPAVQPVQPEPAPVARATRVVRAASSPGSYVVATDEPIVAFLADRPVPPALVDTSWVRLLTGSLTRREVLAVLRSDHVTAVLAGPRLLDSATTREVLRQLFPHHIKMASKSTLYLRDTPRA